MRVFSRSANPNQAERRRQNAHQLHSAVGRTSDKVTGTAVNDDQTTETSVGGRHHSG